MIYIYSFRYFVLLVYYCTFSRLLHVPESQYFCFSKLTFFCDPSFYVNLFNNVNVDVSVILRGNILVHTLALYIRAVVVVVDLTLAHRQKSRM